MPHQITLLLLLLLHVALMLHSLPAEAVRVRKKVPRTRSCLDLPEEILEQMFGRLSVGVMSAFHHALQLEPRDKLNLTCPTAARDAADGKARLPVNLLSISPWAYSFLLKRRRVNGISYDPARYPRYIPEAYCLCQGCLAGPHGEDRRRLRSTPVFAPSVVLRRTGSCAGGRHSYAEVYVSIPVGCTCVPRLEKDPDGRAANQINTFQSPGRSN
uniref:Interleukin-17D-like n=1 Tax=Salarias fasciatus TaxID=181472 RepID=A0A672IU03_SALFA